jgi:hypothetical protein
VTLLLLLLSLSHSSRLGSSRLTSLSLILFSTLLSSPFSSKSNITFLTFCQRRIEQDIGNFRENDFITSSQVKELRVTILSLCEKVKNNAGKRQRQTKPPSSSSSSSIATLPVPSSASPSVPSSSFSLLFYISPKTHHSYLFHS